MTLSTTYTPLNQTQDAINTTTATENTPGPYRFPYIEASGRILNRYVISWNLK